MERFLQGWGGRFERAAFQCLAGTGSKRASRHPGAGGNGLLNGDWRVQGAKEQAGTRECRKLMGTQERFCCL
ncbi:MAG: hypothetical protein E7253_04925 [Lachnospiraceae bacterium]|nr:hypothetical protein [Lachnospiraceae bacterium]